MARMDVVTRAACRTYVMLRYVGFVVALVLLAAGWFAVGPWILVVLLVALLVPATRRRMRPNRWLLGGLAAVVVAATAVVVLLPDGRLPIPPGGGLLVTSSYDGDAVEAQPIELSVPQHPRPGRQRQQHDARRRLGDRQLPGSGAAREGPRGDDVVVRPEGVRDARVRPGRPARRGSAATAPARCCTCSTPRRCGRSRPWTCRTARIGQAAVGGPLRRRLLLPRRAGPRGRRDDRPPHVSPSTATGWRCSTRSTSTTWCRTTTAWSRCCPTGTATPGTSPRTAGSVWRVAPATRPPSTWLARSPTRSPRRHRRLPGHHPGAGQGGARQQPAAGGRLAAGVRQRLPEEARPAECRQRYDADRAAQRARRDHRQRGPADARAVLRHRRRPPGLPGRGVRRGRERQRQLPGRGGRRERRGREQLRLQAPWSTLLGRATTGGLARVDADPAPASARWLALRRGRPDLGRQGLAGHRARLRLHHARVVVGRERVVPHRHRRPHRRDRLLGPHRHRHAVQQPLLRGHARPRRSAYVATLGGMVRVRDR